MNVLELRDWPAKRGDGPCSGLKVLDLTVGMAGAVTSLVLADQGASVLRARPRTMAAAESALEIPAWNRGKSRASFDPRDTKELGRVRELAATTDVLIEGFSPGVAGQLGLDYSTLAAMNPRLVHASISACGGEGPLAGLPGWEGIVAARFGMMADQVKRRPGPTFSPLPLGNYGAALLALQGIMACLYRRELTGAGTELGTSILAGRMAYGGAAFTHIPEAFQKGTYSSLLDKNDPLGSVPGFHLARCGDGRWIQLSCLNAQYWRPAAEALGLGWTLADPRFAGGPRNFEDPQDARALIDLTKAALATRPVAEWLTLFAEHDVPAAEVLDAGSFASHPQVAASGMLSESANGDRSLGKLFSIAPAGQAAHAAPRPATVAPGLGPLAGVKVLDLSFFIAGPVACQFLRELGAEVIKVEPLQGDGWRSDMRSFMAVNMGKKSIIVDLKTAAGRDVIYHMVRDVDVVLHNLRVGVPEKLGMDVDTLTNLNPALVYCHLTPFGLNGPYAARAVWDPIVAALGGLEMAQGGGDEPASAFYSDMSGGLSAAAAAAMALYARARTGQGQSAHATMFGSVAYLNSRYLTEGHKTPSALSRLADYEQHGLGPLYRLYEARSGWVFLGCVTARERERFARFIADQSGDGSLSHADDNAIERLQGLFATRDADDWERELLAAGVPCVRADLLPLGDDVQRQMAENGLMVETNHPMFGPMKRRGTLVTIGGARRNTGDREPLLGEHTREVLRAAGIAEADIERLTQDHIIA